MEIYGRLMFLLSTVAGVVAMVAVGTGAAESAKVLATISIAQAVVGVGMILDK